MTCCKEHGPFGDGWHAKEDVEEIARLRETLDAGLMYGENGVYWHARCQAAHLREAEKDAELARLREALELLEREGGWVEFTDGDGMKGYVNRTSKIARNALKKETT